MMVHICNPSIHLGVKTGGPELMPVSASYGDPVRKKERERKGGREGGREGEREGGREGRREGGGRKEGRKGERREGYGSNLSLLKTLLFG
jgi:hypothetical protein